MEHRRRQRKGAKCAVALQASLEMRKQLAATFALERALPKAHEILTCLETVHHLLSAFARPYQARRLTAQRLLRPKGANLNLRFAPADDRGLLDVKEVHQSQHIVCHEIVTVGPAIARAPAVPLHLRWFTPESEVAFCGRATLAAFHVLAEETGRLRAPCRVAFTCKSGLLHADLSRDDEVTLIASTDSWEMIRALKPAEALADTETRERLRNALEPARRLLWENAQPVGITAREISSIDDEIENVLSVLARAEAAGFSVNVTPQTSSTATAGTVINQSPTGGTQQPQGSTITIVVGTAVMLAGCNRTHSKAAVQAAIDAHLKERPGLALANMTTDVRDVKFDGDRATAQVAFQSKQVPELKVEVRYVLRREGVTKLFGFPEIRWHVGCLNAQSGKALLARTAQVAEMVLTQTRTTTAVARCAAPDHRAGPDWLQRGKGALARQFTGPARRTVRPYTPHV